MNCKVYQILKFLGKKIQQEHSNEYLQILEFNLENAIPCSDCTIVLTFIFLLGNPNLRISTRAQNILPDITSPRLTSFIVNLNASLLVLNFDEPVNSTRISISSFTFQNTSNIFSFSSYATISQAIVLSPNGIQVKVELYSEDLNTIKFIDSLFISLNSSFISHSESAFFDLSYNFAEPILNSSGLRASAYISDTVRPILVCYSLDMDTGLVILSFNEIVNISTIYFPSLAFQRYMDTSGDFNLSYSLTNSSFLNQTQNDRYVAIIISQQDLNVMKMRSIALSSQTSFLSMGYSFIADMTNNFASPLVDGFDTLTPCSYLPDVTPPSLYSFSFDLNSLYLVLTFTETIILYSLRHNYFTLSNNVTSEVHFLFSSFILVTEQNYNDIVIIRLSIEDSNEIKRLTAVATSLNSTFIFYRNNSFSDLFSNFALNRPQSEAIPVSYYITERCCVSSNSWCSH